jgi:hypothetical protein
MDTRVMQRWLFTLGSLGGAGVPLAFVLLLRHALSERQYIAAVVASLATYSVGLWGGQAAGRRTHESHLRIHE